MPAAAVHRMFLVISPNLVLVLPLVLPLATVPLSSWPWDAGERSPRAANNALFVATAHVLPLDISCLLCCRTRCGPLL